MQRQTSPLWGVKRTAFWRMLRSACRSFTGPPGPALPPAPCPALPPEGGGCVEWRGGERCNRTAAHRQTAAARPGVEVMERWPSNRTRGGGVVTRREHGIAPPPGKKKAVKRLTLSRKKKDGGGRACQRAHRRMAAWAHGAANSTGPKGSPGREGPGRVPDHREGEVRVHLERHLREDGDRGRRSARPLAGEGSGVVDCGRSLKTPRVLSVLIFESRFTRFYEQIGAWKEEKRVEGGPVLGISCWGSRRSNPEHGK